jgi:hypothetical protein
MPKKLKIKKISKGVRDRNVKSKDVIKLIKKAGRRKGK